MKCFIHSRITYGLAIHEPYAILPTMTDIYDIIQINESVQGSSDNISATKKGKLWKYVKTMVTWTMTYCTKAGANLFSLTCKLLQECRILSDCENKIVIHCWRLYQIILPDQDS